MIRLTIFALFLLSNILLSAQNVEMTEFDSYIVNFNKDQEPDNFVGSPYLNESWGPIEVDIKGKKVKYRKARYNLLKSHLEVMVNGEKRYIKEGFVSSFRILERAGEEGSVYLYKSEIHIKNRATNGLVRLTKLDQCQILTSYEAKIRKASKENPHLSGMENKDRLVIIKNNYVIVHSEANKIKKAKDLYKLFGDKQKNIKSAIKKQGLDIKTHQGIAAVLRIVNS